MGDGNSDNLIRRMNREGLALWETETTFPGGRRGSEHTSFTDSAQTFEPASPYEPVSSESGQHPIAVMPPRDATFIAPPAQSYQKRLAYLDQKQWDLNAEVEDRQQQINRKNRDISQQESHIRELEQQLRKVRNTCQRLKDELVCQQQELADCREQQNANQHERDAVIRQWQEQQQRYEQEKQREQMRQMQQESHSYLPQRSQLSNRYRDHGPAVNSGRRQPMSADFQPDEWCYQLLLQDKGIPRGYAQAQLVSFKSYWLSRRTLNNNWGHKFVTHVIYNWENDRGQQGEARSVRRQPTTEELTDTSWADRYDFDFD